MARIAGVELPVGKRVDVGLTYIYEIGSVSACDILRKVGVAPETRVKDLQENEVVKLRETIDKEYAVEGDLRKDVTMGIKRLMDIGTYRGLRHRKGLPARGQRTKTNARTRKGRRGAIGGKSKR